MTCLILQMQACLEEHHRTRVLGAFDSCTQIVLEEADARSILQCNPKGACLHSPVYASSAACLGEASTWANLVPVTAAYSSSASPALEGNDQQIRGAGLVRKDAADISAVFLPGDAVCWYEQGRQLGVIKGFLWPERQPQPCNPDMLKCLVAPVARSHASVPSADNWEIRRQMRGPGHIELLFSSITSTACIIPPGDWSMVVPGDKDLASLSPTSLLVPDIHLLGDDALAACLQSSLPPAWHRMEFLVQHVAEDSSICSAICRCVV